MLQRSIRDAAGDVADNLAFFERKILPPSKSINSQRRERFFGTFRNEVCGDEFKLNQNREIEMAEQKNQNNRQGGENPAQPDGQQGNRPGDKRGGGAKRQDPPNQAGEPQILPGADSQGEETEHAGDKKYVGDKNSDAQRMPKL